MMKKIYFLFYLFLVGIKSYCGSLTDVKTWAYQLQGININQIASDTSFELIVIDYSSDGSDATKFSATQIQQIKNSGKKAIAYISIGEAEDYRFYWQSSWTNNPPSFLGPENPDWAGNYKVKFWESQWQNIIFSYIDTIIQQGFDGIYLDIIDAYYYWQVENPQQPLADTLMVSFVQNIRTHISSITPNTFYIIPQNAEDIVNSDNVTSVQKAAYFNAIDAVGVEDVFFYGNLDEDNNYNPDQYRITQLQEYLLNGKQVFSIEYLTQQAKIQQYIGAATTQGFVPLVCLRNLDQLCSGINSGFADITSSNDISIFPNPSTFYSRIILPEKIATGVSIRFFSLTGKLVKKLENSEVIPSGENVLLLNLSSIENGIYLIKIENDFFQKLSKFVIIKEE